MDLDEFISTPESAAAADACANETMSAAIPCHQASAQECDGNSSDGGSTDSEEWLLQLKEAERRLELEEAKRWSQSQPICNNTNSPRRNEPAYNHAKSP